MPKLSSHVVLVSIDGLRSDYVIYPDTYQLRIPNLRAWRARGAYAQGVETVYPSLTYPAHATIVTGMLPADHRITSDYPFSEQSGTEARDGRWFAKEIKVDTIWEAARREGLTTAAVGYPLTAGANIDFNLPEIMGEADGKPLFRHYVNPPGLVDEISSALKTDISLIARFANTIPEAESQDEAKTGAAAYILEKYRPGLILLHLTSFAAVQDKHGPFSTEALAVLEHIDGLLRRITVAVEQANILGEVTLLVVSDHGFAKVEREFRPNVVLAKKGLLTVDAKGSIMSWRAVAQSLGGAAAVLIKEPQDEKTAKEAEEAFREVYEKPDSPIWRIISSREAVRLGADPRAAFFLDAAPSYTTSSRILGGVVSKSSNRGAPGYLPQRSDMRAALIATGQGIKPGARIEYARLIDIAPTVASLLGLQMRAARGRVISELISR